MHAPELEDGIRNVVVAHCVGVIEHPEERCQRNAPQTANLDACNELGGFKVKHAKHVWFEGGHIVPDS